MKRKSEIIKDLAKKIFDLACEPIPFFNNPKFLDIWVSIFENMVIAEEKLVEKYAEQYIIE